MSDHTPGPLEVGFYVPTPRFLAVREHVAVMKPGGELVALTGSSDNERTPSSLADAKLYAAAPDMLAALEWFVSFESLAENVGDIAPGSRRAKGLADARDAIAKARGGA